MPITVPFPMPHPVPALLDDSFPLPLHQAFTTAQAAAAGLTLKRLARLTGTGLLRRPLRGLYVAAQAPDSLRLRAHALSLVVPAGAVVTDTTAGWLHVGDRALPPNAHLDVPALSVFHTSEGHRLRNKLCDSGERRMSSNDVTLVDGVRVTSALRTCLDLGRLQHRDQAFAGIDAMLGVVDHELVLATLERFRGYRGVRQLRVLAPLGDARSGSYGESVLRLRWLDCAGLPRPDRLQIPVPGPDGARFFLDLGIEALKLGVEYDGEEFHTPARREHDARRRAWMEREEGWLVRVVRRDNVFGRHQDVNLVLHQGVREARETWLTRQLRAGRRTQEGS